jgi:ferritin-like metal-binding protein YciE
MLSDGLNRQRVLRQLLQTQLPTNPVAPGPMEHHQLQSNVPPTIPGVFKNSSILIINGNIVLAKIPTHQSGHLWDFWQDVVYEFENTQEGLQTFNKQVAAAEVQADNDIDYFDDATSNLQTINTAVTGIIQAVQTVLAATQSLEGANYTYFQITLSTFLAAFSYLANDLSTSFTDSKTNCLALKNTLAALEDSQLTSTTPSKAVILPPPVQVQALDADQKAVVAPGPFVAVGTLLRINGSKIEVTMYEQQGKCRKTWTRELAEKDNTASEYVSLVSTLFKSKTQLDNSTQKYENITQLIQRTTSLGTTVVGLVQSAVVGTQSLSSGSLQIFQITISALTTLLSIAAKAGNSYVTTLRNNTVAYSGDVAEMLTAQLKP